MTITQTLIDPLRMNSDIVNALASWRARKPDSEVAELREWKSE